MVGKGGLPPPTLNAIQRERGQAALPNPEPLSVINYLGGCRTPRAYSQNKSFAVSVARLARRDGVQ